MIMTFYPNCYLMVFNNKEPRIRFRKNIYEFNKINKINKVINSIPEFIDGRLINNFLIV